MNIEMNLGSNSPKTKKSQGSAANILILGDFSGKRSDDTTSSAVEGVRNMFTFDPNQLDSAVARIAPTIQLDLDGTTHNISVSAMDSFHPDSLLKIDSLLASVPPRHAEPAEQAAPPKEQALTGDENDFARLLGGKKASADAASPVVRSTLDKLIADAVATNTQAPPAAKEGAFGDNSESLREILHAQAFQQLESTWRSLQWLGGRIDYDESTSIWLVDVDLSAIDSWSDDLLRKVAAGPGSAAAIVVLRDYTSSEQSELQALARLAGGLKTIAFAGAAHSLVGLKGDLSAATALDASDFSQPEGDSTDSFATLSNVAIGYPNILLRQPYGERSDPIDAFDFDELETAPPHAAFLWGSASIALSLMWLTGTLVVDDAPLVTYDDGSGQAIKPPTGAYMTDSAADTLLARGIIPMLARRGGTEIRVPRLQSLAITAI